ncbi:telomere length regulation TEL2-like protein [Micractinium conductrix]|uniref:Telomere length regulation TEL2-like protein n=1 Tax=Micractinium conductrix TaxID=554055 RepID=A0A2P6VRV0_9CHLO|nr:telomere length regulation TEL2-like protein [Micractinium conductrix]|eukprot:PSC76828.1 telomere length regulation TEL2-like protein [Micractinium conductrix]
MPDSAALDRLLDAALRAAAAQATAEAGGSPPPQLDAPPSADPAAAACAAVLTQLVPPAVWQARGDARLLLTDKLLVQQQRRLLPLAALRGLLLFLREQRESGSGGSDGSDGTGGSCSILADCAARVAQLWGDASAVQRLASPQQAYLTAALCGALALLSRQQLDAHPQLLPLLLSGTTNRLESPLQSVRRQAMRAGQALSALLDPGKPPMFADDAEQLRQLLTEETWEKAQRAQHGAAPQRTQRQQQNGGVRSGAAAATGSARQRRREERAVRRRPREVPRVQRDAGEDAEGPLTETDSDDAGGSSSDNSGMTSSGSASSAEMEPYDLEESDEDDPAKSKLQLRDLPKMLLSKAEEDWRGQLRALRHAEYLIRAAPDELPQYAVPLARALVHTKVPGWMDEEMPGAGQQGGAPSSASMQRFRNVVSLLVGAPEPAGLALAAEMYGPSMDVYQRAMILDGMAAAASEIAKPGSALPPLPGLRTAAAPQLASPAAARAEAVAAAAAAAGLMPEQQRLLTTTADGAKRVGTVTRLASRSLAAAARRAGTGPAEHVNRFPPLALKWAAALLKRCDEPQHGIDLLGRDHFLLGKLLVTLGAFMEASAQSSEAATLAAATLELMRIGRVHNHPEPYVRRAALLAGGQVLGAVPPARLATAMLGSAASGGAASGVAVSGAAAARDAADEALVSRLEWLRGWTDSVAQGDTDDSCRMMAEGVRKLQSSLAAGALAALCSGQAAAPLDGGSLLPLPSASGAGMGIPVGGLRLPDIRLP